MKTLLIAGIVGLQTLLPLTSNADASVVRLAKTGNVDWTDAATWDGGRVPGATDSVDFRFADGSDPYVWLRTPPNASSVDSILGCGFNFYFFMPWSGNKGDLFGVRQFESWGACWPIGAYSWFQAHSQCGFDLLGDEANPTWLPNLFAGYRPELRVAEGKAGVVDALYNRGMVDKTGKGHLTVKVPLDENIGLNVQDGTLTVSGGAGVTATGDVASVPYLHLNAADEGTVETASGTDTVVAWRDAKTGRAATELQENWKSGWDLSSQFALPTLDRDYAVKGHPLLKFGVMAFPEQISNVREVFMVIAADSLDDNATLPVGCHNYTARNFHQDRRFDVRSERNQNGLVNYYAYSAVTNAQLAINGNPVPMVGYPSDPSELRIVSYAFPDNRTASIMGADRNVGHFGGFHAAEFVVYTNALTAAERRQTVAALKRRWLADGATHDVGIVKVNSETAKIDVPEGETVSVRTVSALSGQPVVKTGEGTLALDRIQPATARIEVKGGKVAFARRTAVPAADAEVAADPLFHLDADDADSFTTAEDGITAWHDTRKDVAFSANLYSGAAKPTLSAVAPTGKNVVDFGADLSATAPRLSFANAQDTREGFIVWKNVYASSGYDNVPQIFGSRKDTTFGYFIPGYLSNVYRNGARTDGAVWTVNGVLVDPMTFEFRDLFGAGAKEFVVIHFVSPHTVSLDSVADACGDKGGGCQVAEYIGYGRWLTDKERRETEAALMAKWLGQRHPDQAGWVGSLAFADDVEPEIDAESDVTVATVETTKPLVKTGAGALTVKSASAIPSYDVRGGQLAVCEDIMADAYFHVDASASDSIEYAKGVAGKAVSRWNDVRGNGRAAVALVSDIGNGEQNLVYPQLKTENVVGLTEGVPYVDFHKYARPADYATTPCSSMRWVDERGSTDGSTKIREVHIVYCEDLEVASAGGSVGAFIGTSNWFTGQRGIGYQFLRSGLDWHHIFAYADYTAKAFMRMDGADLPKDQNGNGDCYATILPQNQHAHVLSLSSTDYDLEANAFCNDRGNCGAGGYRICEVVIYTGTTNSYEKFTAINDYLCKKWRGIGEGARMPTTGSLKASSGTLRLAATTGAVVPKDGSTLTFDFRSPTDYGRIDVDGDFVLAQTGTLVVNLPGEGDPIPEVGRYVLLKADAIAGAENFANWTVSAVPTKRYQAKVAVNAGTGEITLTISRTGMLLFVK